MNSEILLAAIGGINDEYICSAQVKLGYSSFNNTSKPLSRKSSKPARKVIIGLAAAIILLLGTFVTAMAVSEEFREAVFAFFNISTPEVVPETRPDTQNEAPEYSVSETQIDDMIHAKYIWIPGWSSASHGIFHCSNDEIVYNRGSRFELYAEDGGELVPVETRNVNMDYNWNGREYHLEFEWGAYENNLSFAYVFDNGDNGWHFTSLPNNPSAVMITFEYLIPRGDDEAPIHSVYPMLLDLESEEVIDVLKGCGVESLNYISNAVFSDDFTKALLVQEDGTLYYCDVTAKQLYNIDELSGEQTDSCTFNGDSLICWSLNGDGYYDCWSISLSSYDRVEIFENIPAFSKTAGHGIVFISGFDIMHHSGWSYSGSDFALNVRIDKSAYVIDLSTGEEFLIEGFAWPDSPNMYMECVDNPTGSRLLICERDSGSTAYNHIGVIDFVAKSYIRLERENFNVNEQSIYWFDAERVIIATDLNEAGGSAYIYRYDALNW